MAKPGFIWAPKSIMSIAAGMMDGPSDALVTGQGLRAEFFIYRFGESGVVRDWPFACLNPDAEFYTMAQVKEGTRQERQSFQGDAVACLGDPEAQLQRTMSGIALVAVSEGDTPPLYPFECQIL